MKGTWIVLLFIVQFLDCNGGADFEVERVYSPYVVDRDLGPMMSQQPMQGGSFNSFHRSLPSRSSSSYGYQYNMPCPTCGTHSMNPASSSSNSYQSYSSFGSHPTSSNLYPSNFNQNPFQSSSSRHEINEKEEFINGQQTYDLHHERKFKDGQLVYDQKNEKGPDHLGVGTGSSNSYNNQYGSYVNPDRYGPASSNSYGYSSQASEASSSNPVTFASPPRTSHGGSSSTQSNSASYNIIDKANEDKFHRDFQAEVERLREEMRQRTLNNHQTSLINTPVVGNSHRTEFRTQSKFINGQPVYTKKQEKRYQNGKLIHHDVQESDDKTPQFHQPAYIYPSSSSTNQVHRTDTSQQTIHKPQVYPLSYFDQSHHSQSSSLYPSSNIPQRTNLDHLSPQQKQAQYSRQSSYYQSSYPNRQPSHADQSSASYSSTHDQANQPTPTNRVYQPISGTYNQRPSYTSSVHTQRTSQQAVSNSNPSSGVISNSYTPSSHYSTPVDQSSGSIYSHSSLTSGGQTSLPDTIGSTQTQYSKTTGSKSVLTPVFTDDDQGDSIEQLPGTEAPVYAAYGQQPPDEQPFVKAPEDDESDEITDDKGRYDISPFDGLPDATTHDDDDVQPTTTMQTPQSQPNYDSHSSTYDNTQTYSAVKTTDHSATKTGTGNQYPHQYGHSNYDSSSNSRYSPSQSYGHSSSSTSNTYSQHQSQPYQPYGQTQSYDDSQSTSNTYSQSTSGKDVPIRSSNHPGQQGYSSYNSSNYEHHVSNILPSRWVETKTTWKYVNGMLVSEIQFHKYYENGILIHENVTERTRNQMAAEGVDVHNLDLTPSELALYGTPGAARTHSQRHEVHQVKKFKNGQPIYELNHERLFQDGDLVHEDHREKNADDLIDQSSSLNHQLLQTQRLNQHSVTNPGSLQTTDTLNSQGFAVQPQAYVRRHEIRQEQEFVDGKKVYDLHHEKTYKDGQLVSENKTELGPDDLGVKNAGHRDALQELIQGRAPIQVANSAIHQQSQSAQNTLTTSCVTCNPASGSGYGLGNLMNRHSSSQSMYGGAVGSSLGTGPVGSESSYRKEHEVEELYENGKLVKGKEEKKHWRDGHLVDQKFDTYFNGPSRVDGVSQPIPGAPSHKSIPTLSSHQRSKAKCSINPCQNGGRCRPSVSGEICLCRFGFKGKHCDEAYCPNRYCRHGGTCSIQQGRHKCDCPGGYKGQRCATTETVVNLGAIH